MLKCKFNLCLICLLCFFSQISIAQQDYILSAGDIVSVTVFGEPDVSSREIKVPVSGKYNYPLIGQINLNGETLNSLAMIIQRKLKAGFLADPKVSVNMVKYRPVIVIGALEKSGLIDYQEGMTLQILSALLGVNIKRQGVDKVTVQRNNITNKPTGLNYSIKPGDIVTYDINTLSDSYYYIFGEVNRPGRYEYNEGISIEKAIIVAGGYTPFASKKKVTVRNNNANNPVKAKLNTTVLIGDVITVKKRWF